MDDGDDEGFCQAQRTTYLAVLALPALPKNDVVNDHNCTRSGSDCLSSILAVLIPLNITFGEYLVQDVEDLKIASSRMIQWCVKLQLLESKSIHTI